MDWTKAFATGETTTLYLDGDKTYWISVRNELTRAEKRMMAMGSFKVVATKTEGESLDLDLKAGADQKILAYLVDWNIPGRDGKTIDISTAKKKTDALMNLLPEHSDAIEALIDVHVAHQAEKKTAVVATPSSTSTSLDGSA